MRWLSILLIVLAAPVAAADFRVLNFGAPCADAKRLEEALGSQQITERSGPNQQTFNGKVFASTVTIMYLCQDGHLILGDYHFTKQTLEDAVATFRRVYDGLVALYGMPYVDRSPWQYGYASFDPRAVASEPQKYSAAWHDGRVFLSVAIGSASKDKAAPDWQVFVAFSPSMQ
jgi:hypothetical protein